MHLEDTNILLIIKSPILLKRDMEQFNKCLRNKVVSSTDMQGKRLFLKKLYLSFEIITIKTL